MLNRTIYFNVFIRQSPISILLSRIYPSTPAVYLAFSVSFPLLPSFTEKQKKHLICTKPILGIFHFKVGLSGF